MLMFLVIARVSFGGEKRGGKGRGIIVIGSKCIITHAHVFIQSESIFNDNPFCSIYKESPRDHFQSVSRVILS